MGCRITSIIERNVVTIEQHRTVSEGVAAMVGRRVGSVVITGQGQVVGYFTERDLMVRVVGQGRDPAETNLQEVMTRDLVSVAHDATCRSCLERMREHAIRHLLVYEGRRFVGVISMRTLAALMTKGGSYNDLMVNMVGGVVLLVILTVIGFLVYLVPDMLAIAQRFFS